MVLILDNLTVGTTGVVDYTCYEDMKYAVSYFPCFSSVVESLFYSSLITD